MGTGELRAYVAECKVRLLALKRLRFRQPIPAAQD